MSIHWPHRVHAPVSLIGVGRLDPEKIDWAMKSDTFVIIYAPYLDCASVEAARRGLSLD